MPSAKTQITSVHAREVLDSRGRPTVEVEIGCDGGGVRSRAIVPSGASTGRHEACELRDGGERHDGAGVLNAVMHVNQVFGPAILGMAAEKQAEIDQRLCELDGTAQKSRLGANAILGVSLAAAHAAAAAKGVLLAEHLHQLWQATPSARTGRSAFAAPLGEGLAIPLPMVNMISGGLHAGRNLEFQDFLIIPVGAASYSQALEWIVRVYRRLGTLLRETGYEGVLVGDEGGYGPKLRDNEQAVQLLVQAIERADLRPGEDVGIALDVASTHFWDGSHYALGESGQAARPRSAAEMTDLLAKLVQKYPIVSIEDGLGDDDWEGWKLLTEHLNSGVQLIGDDLFVTNVQRLKLGLDRGVANSVLIKVNQIGSLTETFQTLRLALDRGYTPVISARSGETEDATIADLAVATGAGQIKIGSIARSERLAKYNQLLRLEESLGDKAAWFGGRCLKRSIR